MENTAHISDECKRHFKAIRDTQDVLNGKWKMLIMAMLGSEKKRYLELQRLVAGIGPKMLTKELQDLEINGLISRTVMQTKPVTVEYALTDYGRSLKPIMDDMAQWGKNHRDWVMNTK
jgi:DNA-binding HxlR family transcriptional regulator